MSTLKEDFYNRPDLFAPNPAVVEDFVRKMVKRREIDFTSGPLLKRIILYSLPIICVNVLQLLFTAADVAVLGIFASDQAVAAVGGNTSITTLLISFFVGLSIGTNVLVARAVGARDKEKAEKLVGTAVFASLVFGSLIMVGGIALSEQLLLWQDPGLPGAIADCAARSFW